MKRIVAMVLLWLTINAQALVIGTTANYPPLASLADKNNNFFGFEVDIMQAVCQRIKVSCQFKAVVVSTIPEQLLSRKIDLAIAAIVIPPAPVSGYIFSVPYLTSNTQFIAEKDSNIDTPDEIKNKRVGVRKGFLYGGSYLKNFILRLYNNQVKVFEYPTMNDLMAALNNNLIDVAFINAVAADYWFINGDNMYKLVGSRIPFGNGYGIMANAGQEQLIDAINQTLRNMLADGSYLTIYSRYFD